jgi:hypothetical protein
MPPTTDLTGGNNSPIYDLEPALPATIRGKARARCFQPPVNRGPLDQAEDVLCVRSQWLREERAGRQRRRAFRIEPRDEPIVGRGDSPSAAECVAAGGQLRL